MDFHNRLENYKKNYQPLDRVRDKPHSYIRFFNVGEYIIANHCNGVLESDVVSFLLNTHLVPRKIWLCVHGETDFTTKGILGGDPPLNERGICFSRKLCQFMRDQKRKSVTGITVMCDKSLRVAQTVQPLEGEFHVGESEEWDVDRILQSATGVERRGLFSHDLRGDQEEVPGRVCEAGAKQAGVSVSRRRVVSGREGAAEPGADEDCGVSR